MKFIIYTILLNIFLAYPMIAFADEQLLNQAFQAEIGFYSNPDYEKAANYYEQALKNNSKVARIKLFELYSPNGPLWKDYNTWEQYLKPLVEENWPPAMREMALYQLQLNNNNIDSIELLKQAAYLGDLKAAEKLAEIFLSDDKNQEQKILWVAMAAQYGSLKFAALLGEELLKNDPAALNPWLEEGILKVSNENIKKRNRAKYWLLKSPYGKSKYLLGNLYLLENNINQAIEAYENALENNYIEAELSLALVDLIERQGHRPNLNKNLQRFKNTAQENLPEAQYQLGLMYNQGISTPKDSVKAAYWFTKASANGHKKAAELANKLTQNFSLGQKNRLEKLLAADET